MNKYIPQKLKKKKSFKRLKLKKNRELKHYKLKNGNIGLKALSSGNLTPENLEAFRRHLRRKLLKEGFIKFYAFPYVTLFKKSTGARMGKGHGKFTNWIYPVKKGKIFIELWDINKIKGLTALTSLQKKIPFLTKIIIKKNDF